MSNMATKIWDLAPIEIKKMTTINEFKAKIKIWKLRNVPVEPVKLTFHR